MPHKRAKRSAREQQRKERGTDLAPPGAGSSTSLSNEGIPKSVSRVLDAARIHAEYRQKKRARLHEEDGSADAPKKRRRAAANPDVGDKATAIEIQPGESLKHFNRRVEDHMRPLVRSAVRVSAATERKERKSAATVKGTTREPKPRKAEDGTTTPSAAAQHHDRPKEFATISSARPRRLNDIATAPPVLKKLPRGASSNLAAKRSTQTKAGGVLSMAQRVMMETERENAIQRYREMRERKVNENSERSP